MNTSKNNLLTLLMILGTLLSAAQKYDSGQDSLSLHLKSGIYTPLSYFDSIYITSLPVLELPDSYKGNNAPLLPPVVDNSTQPFMRPVFNQAGYSCGQASLIGYNFTYEMNYVRNTSADEPENQHPTHFTWNWMNGSNYYGGVSYYHSIEVLRHVGDPSVADYGGMSAGGEKRWMSGYDLYYNAMHNRIWDAFNIRTDTYEGFMTLKHWVHSHLENSTAGGVGSFYANQPYMHIFPNGSPEAGKHVCTGWQSSASHALCIVGYNDSIRWDYNSDGMYTNNLDINGDGKVTVKDWEVGGFKFVNSYGGVPAWGDSGYCYMMYKTVADVFGEGGIWNNTVNVLKPKYNCSPQLTMKVTLTHTCRYRLRITAGVSDNIIATAPTYVMSFPIFNFQGECLYMQGGITEADKTIEFGLDITPLLNYLQSGQEAKFFLQVEESDPENWGTGQINSFSLMNYAGGVTEIPCGETNVPIQQNSMTRLSVTSTINYNDVTIQTASLPPANLYEPYSCTLTATGGISPYEWSLRSEYQETSSPSSFPAVTAEQLIPTNNTTGYAMKALPFQFPFYGEFFDTVYIYVNGFLKFDNFLVTFPYHKDNYQRFLKNRNIAPRFDFNLQLYPSSGDGLWYQGDPTGATFRWNISQTGMASSSDLNMAIKLYPDGKIEFYYGTSTIPSAVEWYAGATKGDAKNYHIPAVSGINPMPQNTKIELNPYPYPLDMSMDVSGHFQGTPGQAYTQYPVTFMATDENNISSKKTLAFTTTGIQSDFVLHAGTDAIIEPGDTVLINVTLKNLSNSAYTGAAMKLTTEDALVTLTDNVQPIGTIQPGQVLSFPDAFSFLVSNSVSDGHPIDMEHIITAVQDTLQRPLTFRASAPVITAGLFTVLDYDDNILDPGETADVSIVLHNGGGGKAVHLVAGLSSPDPYITMNHSLDTVLLLPAHSDTSLLFHVTVAPQTPYGHIACFSLVAEGDPEVTIADSLYMIVGVIAEDFETGDFTRFPWYFAGQEDWAMETGGVYEGIFSSRSGTINDSQSSALLLQADILSTSRISFYSRVSSEPGYDFLIFLVDGSEKGRWSGESTWEKHTYTVEEGPHILQWKYQKDGSVVGGSDCAWVDYIVMPPTEAFLLTVYAGNDDTICQGSTVQLDATVFNASSVEWATSGSGTFDDNTIPDPIYTPGTSDINNGHVTLTITGSNDQDLDLSDNMQLTVNRSPYPFAGPDRYTCEGSPVTLDAEVTYADSTCWTTGGDGTFNDPDLLDVTYTPGQEDLSNGAVHLILTAYPNLPCTESTADTMLLGIQWDPQAYAGEDDWACENAPYILSGAAENSGSVLWESTGDGVFSNPTQLETSYTPGSEDISMGTATLTLTAFGLDPCTGTESDSIVLTLDPGPAADAGEDQTILYNTFTTLAGMASGGSGNYSYFWEPDVYLEDPALQNPVTIPLTNPVTFTLTVTDNATGCPQSDDMTVFIEGSPFELTVTATPNPVCTGDAIQLYADPQGTTGPFTFLWTSDPPGFTSTLQYPTDTPLIATTYFATVTDDLGNVIQGYVLVGLIDPPVASAGDDMTLCFGYPFTLQGQAGNYSEVQWHTFGDGSFNDASLLNAVYTPGPADLIAGDALLQILVTGIAPCNIPASDMIVLSYWPETQVTLSELPDLCFDDPPYLLTGGSPEGGTYSGTGVDNGYFYPGLAGTGTFMITYAYTDGNECSFTAGRPITVDECTAINDQAEQTLITVIPNPNQGVFTVQVDALTEETYFLRITDPSGSIVYEHRLPCKAGRNAITVNLDRLEPGIYILSVSSNRILTTRKIAIY